MEQKAGNEYQQKTKEELFEEKLKVAEKRLDKQGVEMDTKIIDTVAILNLYQIPTSGSCEGHIDHGIANPWVNLKAVGEPEERFVGEKATKQSIGDQFHISPDEVGRGQNEEANIRFWDTIGAVEKTPEYRKWMADNEKLAKTMSALIDEFYTGGKPDPLVAINLLTLGGIAGRIQSGPDEIPSKNLNPAEESALRIRLSKRQEEMKRFTEFLKKRMVI